MFPTFGNPSNIASPGRNGEGATVVPGARRVDRIQSVVTELKKRGGKALAVGTDVTDFDRVKRLVDTTVQTYGRIDVMLNNAGHWPSPS